MLRSVNHDPTARPCRMRTVDGARRIEALVGKSSNGNENRDRGQVLCQLRRRFRPTRRQFYTGLDGPPRRRSRTRPRPDGGAAPTAPAPPPAPALCPRLRAGAGARADPDRGGEPHCPGARRSVGAERQRVPRSPARARHVLGHRASPGQGATPGPSRLRGDGGVLVTARAARHRRAAPTLPRGRPPRDLPRSGGRGVPQLAPGRARPQRLRRWRGARLVCAHGSAPRRGGGAARRSGSLPRLRGLRRGRGPRRDSGPARQRGGALRAHRGAAAVDPRWDPPRRARRSRARRVE